jgi:ribonucleoside-diphosphate reductase alpha chain
MDKWNKDVFKTAFELDQRWIIEHASVRQPFIDQAQSINLFFKAGSNVQDIYDVHMRAWKHGLKSLYYLRSSAESRASTGVNERKKIQVNDTECLSCQ